MSSDVPPLLSLLLVRDYLRQASDNLIASTSLTPESENNELDGGIFCKAVASDFRKYCYRLRDDGKSFLGALQLPESTVDRLLIEQKKLAQCKAHGLSVCSMKNQRRTMEDRHIVLPCISTAAFSAFANKANDDVDDVHALLNADALYAVFDGHGGEQVAAFAAAHFLRHLLRVDRHLYRTAMDDALAAAFASVDAAVVAKMQRERLRAGACAAVAHLRAGRTLTVGWCGDSQAILVDRHTVRSLTWPHSTGNEVGEYYTDW